MLRRDLPSGFYETLLRELYVRAMMVPTNPRAVQQYEELKRDLQEIKSLIPPEQDK